MSQQRIALMSVVAAVVLVTVKLATGLATGSLGLIAEALHSATDLVAAVLTLFAIRVAVRPPDRDHQYGHGKAEHLAALGEATFLALASAFIGYQALDRLMDGGGGHVEAAWYAFAVLGFVVVLDISRVVISVRGSRKFHSPALASNALHFASDLLGSVAVLVGLVCVRAGYEDGDAIAALVVAALVILAAIRLARGNVQVLMDRAPADAALAARAAIEAEMPRVDIRRLRAREAAGKYFVDVVVGLRPDAAVAHAHDEADAIEAAVRGALDREADVVVHVEPEEVSGLRDRINAAAVAVGRVREVHNVRVLNVDGSPEASLHLKLPASLSLHEAHDVTTEVEHAIRAAAPELTDVHTHIEPLSSVHDGSATDAVDERTCIETVVRELTGNDPLALRLREGGERDRIVALLTIHVDAALPLRDAHALATEVEEEVVRRAPTIADVIVHTEPR